MPRTVWKGAISFGLVHVPVVLHPGARRADIDFDWIDRRDMAPVGYSRINKKTGKPIEFSEIVKGYQYEKGEYVLMSDEDFRQANPTATQTVEIVCFVKAKELPPYYFETPYYLVPDKRGDKGYALLRETLRRSDRVGIANVVLHTKQHLAAVMVVGDVIVLNTMRYADEILPVAELKVPSSDLGEVGVSERETEMAMRLVDDMTEKWKPERFHDEYREDLMARIEQKIETGQTHTLAEVEEGARPAQRGGGKVIDLMAMLKQSIESRSPRRAQAAADDEADDGDARAPAKKAAPARKSAAKKAAGKTAAKTAAKTAGKTAARKAPAKAAAKKAAGKTAAKSAGHSGTRRRAA